MKKFKFLLPALLLFTLACSNSDDDSSDGEPFAATPSGSSTNVGDFSNFFLSNNRFKTLEIQLAHEPNVKPTPIALDSLKQFLQRRLNKNSISFTYTVIPDQNRSTYSIGAIREIEVAYKTASSSTDKSTAFFFFANGSYDQDAGNSITLGVAFNANSMALFQKTIVDNTGGLGQPSRTRVEEGVLKHEFGHILGLVNLGAPLQSSHEDGAHLKHCDVEACLMYYAIETGSFFNNIMNAPMPDLDAQCVADLRANGGK